MLERFPGKGGWTYASIPEIPQDREAPFGWVKVKGTIDGYEIKSYNLMPMGNGILFMSVKAEIRKKIKKDEGDYVHITLYADNEPYKIPVELKHILEAEPGVYEKFLKYKKWEQRCVPTGFFLQRGKRLKENAF